MTETFTDYLDTGSGSTEFRVAIEGCPIEFCTAYSMRGTISSPADQAGVRRVSGLLREGLSFSERANLPGADYTASLGSASIVPEDTLVAWNRRAADYAFSKVPRVVGYLLSSCTASDTTLYVSDASQFSVGTVYHLDTEAVLVTARDTLGDPDSLTVTRGMWRTTAQAHFVAASTLIGDRTLICPIYDAPPTYRRRRVWVYGHGRDELGLTDTGTLLARGVMTGAPTLSGGTTWSFSISPLTSLLDAEIGPREGAAQITGIYYPGASPFRVAVYRRTGPSEGDEIDDLFVCLVSGFFRTQEEWCAALQAELDAGVTTYSWGETFSVRPVGTTWEIYVTTDSSPNTRYISVMGGSAVDGACWGSLTTTSSLGDAWVPVVSGDTEYRVRWVPHTDPVYGYSTPVEGLRGAPRALLYAAHVVPDTVTQIASYPWWRVYLASSAGVQIGDVLRLDIPEAPEQPARSWTATITAVDADDGYVEWDPDTMRVTHADGGVGMSSTAIWTVVTPAAMPSVSLPREYGLGQSLAYLLGDVWSDAPDNANAGTVPFILPGDFAPFEDIVAAVEEAAAGAPWLLHRRWTFAKPVRFSDVVKHELRLLGAFMATDSTGAITIRPLTPRIEADHSIVADDLVNDRSLGELVTEPDGVLTGYTIRTGYDAAEDDHKGRDLEVTMLGALARQRTRAALEIAPKSVAAGVEPTAEEIISHLGTAVALWSRHRAQVTVDVLTTHHGVRLGDCVYVTIPQLPYDTERGYDGAGGGIIAIRGTAVGRAWRFDEGAISLSILFDSLDIAGYTPTGRVTAQTGSGTTTVTVTLDTDEYGPGGDVADVDFFVAGMKVRLVEWDTSSPTEKTGTITSIAGNVVSLTMDSAWTEGTSTWNLLFSPSTTSGLTTTQLEYAWIARDDRRVHLASGTQAGKEFAP